MVRVGSGLKVQCGISLSIRTSLSLFAVSPACVRVFAYTAASFSGGSCERSNGFACCLKFSHTLCAWPRFIASARYDPSFSFDFAKKKKKNGQVCSNHLISFCNCWHLLVIILKSAKNQRAVGQGRVRSLMPALRSFTSEPSGQTHK